MSFVFILSVFLIQGQNEHSYDTHRVPYRLKSRAFIFVDSASMLPISGKEWEGIYWFDKKSGYAKVKVNGKWGVINASEEFVIPAVWDYVDVVNGMVILLGGERSCSIRNEHLEEMIPSDLQVINFDYITSGYFWLYSKNGSDTLYALMNRAGKILIPFGSYQGFKGYPDRGFVTLKSKGAWAVCDTLGNPLTDFIYEDIFLDDHDSCIIVKSKGRFGFIDKGGKELIAPEYEYADFFHDGLAAVKKDGKWGYVNLLNEEKIPFRFSRARNFHGSIAAVSENGTTYGMIDTAGRWIILPDYSYLSDMHENRVIYREKKLCGLMDGKGKKIMEPTYHDIAAFSEGISLVSRFVNLKEQWGFIDTTGMVVIPLFNYLNRTPSREFSLISFESYVRGINSFYSGFTAVETKIYEGKKMKEWNIEYFMDRAGRRYAEKRFW